MLPTDDAPLVAVLAPSQPVIIAMAQTVNGDSNVTVIAYLHGLSTADGRALMQAICWRLAQFPASTSRYTHSTDDVAKCVDRDDAIHRVCGRFPPPNGGHPLAKSRPKEGVMDRYVAVLLCQILAMVGRL